MSERVVQKAVIQYLAVAYPKAEYRTDKDGVFIKGNWGAKKEGKQGKKGFPDLLIKTASGDYRGLVLELKDKGVTVFKKDGTLRKDDHLRDQLDWIHWFRELGCIADFAIGFEDAKQKIDNYFNKGK